MLVCASSVRTNSSRSTFEVRGSNTRRTAASLPDSSRTVSSTRQHELLGLLLVGGQRLLAGLDLRIGQFLDFLEHALGRRRRRQFAHDQLPLAARQFLELEARAHLQAAAAARVDLPDVARRRDDLSAAREVRSRQLRKHVVELRLRIGQQQQCRRRDFAQVVRRHLGRHADRDARRAIEQHERQARRQQPRLLRRAVVVRHEIDGAFVDLVEQQARDRREPRLGVAHRRRAVAVATAEVALPVDQRIAQREVLRHAHQRVIRSLVAVRMESTEHVADDARRLHRARARGQAHLVHREENAALDRLLAVGTVGQCAALDDRDRVVEISALCEVGQRQRIVPSPSRPPEPGRVFVAQAWIGGASRAIQAMRDSTDSPTRVAEAPRSRPHTRQVAANSM